MKLCTFINNEQKRSVGLVMGEKVLELTGYRDMVDLIENYDTDKIESASQQSNKEYAFEDVKFMAPVTKPSKMIFVGLNYLDHAKETNSLIPEIPIFFPKYSNSLLGHKGNVIIPKATSKCDYEAEFAFIIGKKAKHVTEEDAMDYVFGYTICNDVSARDLQKQTSQWLRGKAVDTFAPMGPVLVTADEITNPHNLNISCKINGDVRQKSNTKELIFKIPFLIHHLSKTITLEPGDIISTGTPSGVAMGMETPLWLKDGDVCEVEIEGLGVLRNTFINE